MQNEKNRQKAERSFSSKVKEELARQWTPVKHCQIAELTALIVMCGGIRIDSRERYSIKIHTENISVARKYFTLVRKTFNIDTDILVSQNRIHKNVSYTVSIKSHEDAMKILHATKLMDDSGEVRELSILNACCKRAFLRGAFLANGSMSNPQKAYHLEIVCVTRGRAQQIKSMIDSFGLEAKIVIRKKAYVVYLKEGSQIVDLLNVMEAPVALMELENIRILKEMRNSVNRKVNCETANINKTVSAAVKQVEDIAYIRDTIGLHKLAEGLEEIATLRLRYPEATLKELGELLSEPVGKSGVNHRLRKLSAIAQDLRENKEEEKDD